jgi:hypothetical protein
MTVDRAFRYAALVCMALAVIAGAITANAPAGFVFLWQLKAATAGLTGLAALFLKPPGSPTSVL